MELNSGKRVSIIILGILGLLLLSIATIQTVAEDDLPPLPPPEDEIQQPLVLEDIFPKAKLYDRMRPPKKDQKATTVFFHVTVMGLDSLDENSMTYVADIFFGQSWKDHRLQMPSNMTLSSYRLLPVSWLKYMWRPDSFFKNAKSVTFQTMTIPNDYIWLDSEGTILYMVKLTLLLSCSMTFHKYPHDTQICSLKIESLSHTVEDLQFIWDPKLPLDVNPNIELPQLDLVSSVTGDCTQLYLTGNFSCIEVIFTFKRRLGYYLVHTYGYMPTCLIVVMSWISFFMKPEAVPARITLGVTSLLTLSTQHANSQKYLPPVSYVKAIDIFMNTCTLFVFLSLMEYALINIIMGDLIENREMLIQKSVRNFRRSQSRKNGERIPMRALSPDQVEAPEGGQGTQGPQGLPPTEGPLDGPEAYVNMAQREKALLIDRLSRITFPLLFTLFNLGYWIVSLTLF